MSQPKPRVPSGGLAADGPVLVLTASAGTGHTIAAQAVAEALRAADASLRVEVIDVLQLTNRFFRALYAQGYLSLVNHAPTAMGLIYEATDRPDHRLRDALRSSFQNANARRVTRFLEQRRPRLIVNTHFLPAEIVALQRRTGKLACPQVTITTDFETHRLWVQEPTERYYTATAEGKAYLCTWGVAPERVLVSGIPIRSAFGYTADADALRDKHGVSRDRPLALLLCGGFGVGPTDELLSGLLTSRHELGVVVVTGKNEALRRRLTQRIAGSRREVRILGYTECMHEWMQLVDLVVSKPGGLTASEALACGRPIVIVSPIPGQETRNADFLLEHGLALKVNNVRLLAFRIDRLLDDPNRLAQMQAAALACARPAAAHDIAQDALTLLRKPPLTMPPAPRATAALVHP